MRTVERMVEQEVIQCVTVMVDELSETFRSNSAFGDYYDTLSSCHSKPDYEEAAVEHIQQMTIEECQEYIDVNSLLVDDNPNLHNLMELVREHARDDFQAFCNDYDIEPEYSEVFEYWTISNWLYEKLEEKGEVVFELFDLKIWGRTTTGQAIDLDWVMNEIYNDTFIIFGDLLET